MTIPSERELMRLMGYKESEIDDTIRLMMIEKGARNEDELEEILRLEYEEKRRKTKQEAQERETIILSLTILFALGYQIIFGVVVNTKSWSALTLSSTWFKTTSICLSVSVFLAPLIFRLVLVLFRIPGVR